MKHYTEDELAWYAFDPEKFGDRPALEQHLKTCADCRETVEFIRTLDGALGEQTPWDIATDLETAQPAPPSLLNLADQIQSEQLRARDLLKPYLSSLDNFRRANIENLPEFQTSGVVRVLADLAEQLRLKDPQFALSVANAAISIGKDLRKKDALRSTSYLGDAWKERAIALGTIGKFRDAEDATMEAELAYDADPLATEHDLAAVQLVRANLFVETDRLAEAEKLAGSAALRFRSFGDTERYMNARLLQGNVLYMRRDYRAATNIIEEVIPSARKTEHTLVLARALSNAGEARAALGDYAVAQTYLDESRRVWHDLGYPQERIRASWSLANILLNTGNVDDAIERLEQVYRDFDAIGIVNDAALARLQLAEALLVAERPADVSPILEGVVVSFSAEGLTRNANMALAYLREAVDAHSVDVELVRDVRLYLEELPFAPEREFTRH